MLMQKQPDLFGPPPFFNTVELAGDELKRTLVQAQTQESLIMARFRVDLREFLTPEDLLPFMPKHTPITSVRRAMTNLTTRGELEKVPLAVRRTRGKLGKPVHSWRLKKLGV